MKKQTLFDNWAGGVNTTMRPDALPPNTSPRGRNSILSFLGGGRAIASKRPGALIVNTAPITGRPAVIGQFEFDRLNAGVLTQTHVLVDSLGGLTTPNGAAAPIAVDAGNPTPFSAGALTPSFATLNNLLFMVVGTTQKKLSSNAKVQNWGIATPTAAPTVTAGVAGTPNGSYDIALSYYNSSTGHESSRGPYNTVNVTNQKINVSWTAPTDPQVDFVFVHIRKSAIMSDFFRLVTDTVPATDPVTGGFAVATTSMVTNVTDTELTALTILTPDVVENNPPPSGLIAATAHLSRMFVADKSQIYFSKPKLPEAFDPNNFELVNPNDGQNIVTIGSYFGILLVWKQNALYGLYGTEPNNWYVQVIDPQIGATSGASIVYHEGVLYWWSRLGPAAWSGQGPVRLIGQEFINPTISRDNLQFSLFNQIVAASDADLNLVMWAVPENGQSTNTLLLAWNARGQVWNTDGWNLFDVASMATVKDNNGKPWVMLGNYAGRIFQFANANSDGARIADAVGNIFTLSGKVVSATSLTLTDTLATFDTTDDALKKLFIYARDANGNVQRRRISSNTGTVITIDTAWDAIPDATYTYAIAAPHFEWDTMWNNDGEPFYKKRGLFCFNQVLSDSGQAQIQVDLFADYDEWDSILEYTFSASGQGGVFDVSQFDLAFFGSLGITYSRYWVGKKFRSYRLRLSNLEPNSQVALVTTSLEVSLLSEKN